MVDPDLIADQRRLNEFHAARLALLDAYPELRHYRGSRKLRLRHAVQRRVGAARSRLASWIDPD